MWHSPVSPTLLREENGYCFPPIFLIAPAIQHLLTTKAKATVIVQISSLDHTGGPCAAQMRKRKVLIGKKGEPRGSSVAVQTPRVSWATPTLLAINGFSNWKEIYFKQYYLFPLSFLFLVCSPAIYNLETFHSNGVFSLLRAERPILSVIYWPILSVSETPLSTRIPLLTQNLSRHAGMD